MKKPDNNDYGNEHKKNTAFDRINAAIDKTAADSDRYADKKAQSIALAMQAFKQAQSSEAIGAKKGASAKKTFFSFFSAFSIFKFFRQGNSHSHRPIDELQDSSHSSLGNVAQKNTDNRRSSMAFYQNKWFLSVASTACVAVFGVMLFTKVPPKQVPDVSSESIMVTEGLSSTLGKNDVSVKVGDEQNKKNERKEILAEANPAAQVNESIRMPSVNDHNAIEEIVVRRKDIAVKQNNLSSNVKSGRAELDSAIPLQTQALAQAKTIGQKKVVGQKKLLSAKKMHVQPMKKSLSRSMPKPGYKPELSGQIAQSKSLVMPPIQKIRPQPIKKESRDRFEKLENSAVKRVAETPVSTFSIDVDTSAYSYVRRELNSGRLPKKDAVRLEEMVNYFSYDYPLSDNKSQPFKPSIVVTDSPWSKEEGKKLVHIGIKGYELNIDKKPASNLVFLLDVSGSMNSQDKLPLVKQSMQLLLSQLKPTDTVSIVVYAGAAGTVLEPTKVSEKQKILNALTKLSAGGSTAGGRGIELAYKLAQINFQKNAINRIILATDGDFNVGVKSDKALKELVERKRDKGIYLSVLGFGQGNYQDALMQTLAQNGNGNAAYIDTLSEAQKVLVDEGVSTLFPIANDVKIQVEFNPATVAEYRLLGYQTRQLKREDFNNDKVDAGDIGAGHTVTAIYEITPVTAQKKLIDNLRYSQNMEIKEQKNIFKPNVGEQAEYGFLKMRYKLPGQSQSKLLQQPIAAKNTQQPNVRLAAWVMRETQFSTAVAAFSQHLRGGAFINDYSYDDIIALAQNSKGDDPYGYRTEFIQLVRKAKMLSELQ